MSATDFETANETAGATSAPGIDAIVAGSVVPLAVVVVADVAGQQQQPSPSQSLLVSGLPCAYPALD